jgi:hypothetical protein
MGDLQNVKGWNRIIFGSAMVKKCTDLNLPGTFLRLRLSKDTKSTFKEEEIMRTIVIVMLAVMLSATGAWAGVIGNAVEVRVISDDGRMLPIYPVKMGRDVRKVYAEAIKGDHYRIEVKNRINRRIGLVIAVDGRNIISGTKSFLKNSERMYIIEPYGSGAFAGWRTAQDRINRFYFTDVSDSYAAAFGDESAMGVIAVAVYPEVRRCGPPTSMLPQTTPSCQRDREENGADAAGKAQATPSAPLASGDRMKKEAARLEQAMESAGTGYGRNEYSPIQVVAFEPERRAAETVYVKYEWRSSLCKLGVIGCSRPFQQPYNRLWDNEGYAPPPPLGFRR